MMLWLMLRLMLRLPLHMLPGVVSFKHSLLRLANVHISIVVELRQQLAPRWSLSRLGSG
jgi:hypothetical protein